MIDTTMNVVATTEDVYVLLGVNDETYAECAAVCPQKKYSFVWEKELAGFRYVWKSFATRIWK